MAKLLKVEVDKIYLYPLGGVSKFFLPLNASQTKELLISLSGPIFQQLAKILLVIIFPKEYHLINAYHYGILIFNFLPIYPLDGGKLLNIFFSKFLPFEKGLKLSIAISYLTLIIYFILSIKTLTINNIIIILFLLYKIVEEHKQINYIYEKFILERYLNNYKFKSSKLIKNPKNFYRNKRHLIKVNNTYYLEKEYLEKKYKK